MADTLTSRMRRAVEGLTPGYFALVMASGILSVGLALAEHRTLSLVLLAMCSAAFVVLLGRPERPVLITASGTWFIWVVATQSVAAAAATMEPVVHSGRREVALLAVVSWSVGVFLYGATGVFVSLRLMLHDFGPEELTPPYWVSMGALAITVLAGARIVEMADAPVVDATKDLIAGLAVVFWSFATWLIPVLVAAGWWRHVIRRIPLRYEPTLWSIVFPLGMYAVAGIYLGDADRLPVVRTIGSTMLWVAFAAWALTLAAMVVHVTTTVFFRPRVTS